MVYLSLCAVPAQAGSKRIQNAGIISTLRILYHIFYTKYTPENLRTLTAFNPIRLTSRIRKAMRTPFSLSFDEINRPAAAPAMPPATIAARVIQLNSGGPATK